MNGSQALVTGAGRGLGWGIAKAFASAGARVCATDVNLDELATGMADISSPSGNLMSCHLDVANPKEFNQVVKNISIETVIFLQSQDTELTKLYCRLFEQ